MKLGAAYPTTEVAGNPDAIKRFVNAVTALGFEHMMAYDHRPLHGKAHLS
jgi:hypothetical protein